MDLVLVGLSGSGKTAVGKRLADRCHCALVDLDELVEKRTGRSVQLIFADEGEVAFRRHEREAILSLGPADPDPKVRRVIATGGGAVVDPRNRWLLYRGRIPVWLDGSVEILAGRLNRSSNVRPLVADGDTATKLRDLLAERERFYAPAQKMSTGSGVPAVVGALHRNMPTEAAPGTTLLRADTTIGRVEIGDGIAATAVSAALRRQHARRAVLVAEPKTWEVAGARIGEQLAAEGWQMERVMLPRGENAKRLRVIEQAARELARLRVDRKETLVAIGGGALTDTAGFLAATYLRGIPVIQVPTTLVGMIDAALGGKTAVDLPEGKNLVGAFHQPVAFVADVSFLRTLPARQLRAALGEAVKMGFLGDERLLELIEEQGEEMARGDKRTFENGAFAEVVERSAWAKVEVVTADEREAGLRMTLNLGHTIGHGIEAAAGYGRILHGEAVAYGLRGAFAISRAMDLVPPERAMRANALLDHLRLGVEPPYVALDAVYEHMETDKKHGLGRLSWVLPTDSGVVVRSDVPVEAVEAGLAAALRLAGVSAGA